LYGKWYKEGAESIPVSTNTTGSISVKSGENVVAPGTKSDKGLSFGISGTPEVKTKVEVTIEAQDIYLKQGTYAVIQEVKLDEATYDDYLKATLSDAKDAIYYKSNDAYTLLSSNSKPTNGYTGEKFYKLSDIVTVSTNDAYPISYTATGNDKFNSKTKATEIATQIATVVSSGGISAGKTDVTTGGAVRYTVDNTYDAGTVLTGSSLSLESCNISWKWDIGSNTEANSDTILGDLIAETDDVVLVNTSDKSVEKLTVLDTGVVITPVKDKTKYGSNDVVGSTKTKFDITITATQVD
jgi:hypothetical protein